MSLESTWVSADNPPSTRPAAGNSISVIVPTFNRWPLITKAIDSALSFVSGLHFGEIIIIDDASTDNTVSCLKERYSYELAQGRIKILVQSTNGGPDVARNRGGSEARGTWLLFLDSDDWLITERFREVEKVLSEWHSSPLVFFRCIDQHGDLVGPEQENEMQLSAREFLTKGTPGECIPIIRRDVFLKCGYDEDLRGWGGPAYYRIIKRYGAAKVFPLTVRVYNTESSGRMSLKSSLRARALNMARGHARILRYCIEELIVVGTFKQILKVCYYLLLASPIGRR